METVMSSMAVPGSVPMTTQDIADDDGGETVHGTMEAHTGHTDSARGPQTR